MEDCDKITMVIPCLYTKRLSRFSVLYIADLHYVHACLVGCNFSSSTRSYMYYDNLYWDQDIIVQVSNNIIALYVVIYS